MSDSKEFNSIKDLILSKIKDGRVKMKPKWQFILKALLIILGIVILTITLLLLVSFFLFFLRRSGLEFMPSFGFRGMSIFIASLPWVLIVVASVFFVLLEILVRHYSFAYKKPIIYSLLGILAVVFLGGFIIFLSGIHQKALIYSKMDRLPIAGKFYKNFEGQRPGGVYLGEILKLKDGGFLMLDRESDEFDVIISAQTRLPFGGEFNAKDRVVVFGDRDNFIIRAKGVRRVENVDDVFGGPGMKMIIKGPPPLIPD